MNTVKNILNDSGSAPQDSGSLSGSVSGSISGSALKGLALALALLVSTTGAAFAEQAPSRIKDIADIEGVRKNVLIGYGLVVGLAGTGDSANAIPFTRQTLINMLERMGVNSKAAVDTLKTKNVAAVMVTAELPPFSRQGSRIDVTVSSLGDAKSLEGGQLLATPLLAADGNTYAVAQGSLIIGGFTAEGAAGTVSKNHTTAGRIASGAVVEQETGFELSEMQRVRLILRNPDFTTALRMSEAINRAYGGKVSQALDNHTVDVSLPDGAKGDVVAAIFKIENLKVRPDETARVVIDEKTGTIVMGEDVRLSSVAISHSNLTIRVNELEQVSQPNPLSQTGTTETVDRTNIQVDEGAGKFRILETGVTLADLVKGLNNLGVKPRDIISILQTLKAAGAMQADIKVL